MALYLNVVATYLIFFLTLVAVAAYAIFVSRRMDVNSLTNFLSAKNSQGPLALAWCFFASGMGSWTLFTFPEIGVLAGSWGVIGYTLSGCLGMAILALVGPFTRSLLGEGVTLTDFVNNRFGRVMQIYVAIVSVFYQFFSLVSEFTCVGSLVSMISPDAEPAVAICAVAVITNIYTLVGGLRASLATDVWQASGVLSLVLLVVIVMISSVKIPDNAWQDTKVAAFTVNGFESLLTLWIAVTASNLFFTGYWQRVFAANDDKTLRKACIYTCLMIIPFTVALAMSGWVSFLAYPAEAAQQMPYFFTILMHMHMVWKVLMVIIIAALASSMSDSIQIGIAAELVTNFPGMTLLHARIICILLNIPAVIIALKNVNILTLFLIADLLCTATVGPMLLGAWKRAHPHAAVAGCVSGLITIFLCGWIIKGSFVDGFKWFALPEGLYSSNSLITFVFSGIVPVIVTVAGSLMLPPREVSTQEYLPALTPTRQRSTRAIEKTTCRQQRPHQSANQQIAPQPPTYGLKIVLLTIKIKLTSVSTT
ncbi:TPA: hypothetical protein N0F65_007382, partial [Lagenidium giganteum]